MMTLRNYEALIREYVNKINEGDPNWKWSIKSFGKYKVNIRWGYLDYCQEKDNCFILRLDDTKDEEFNDYYLSCRTPQDDMIDGHIVSEDGRFTWQESFENAIKSSILAIAEYAHSRY